MFSNKITGAIILAGGLMFTGATGEFLTRYEDSRTEPLLSPGCAQVNNPVYDALYWGTGLIGENGFGGPFNPGDMLIVSASPPVDYAVPSRIFIFTIPPDGVVVEAAFPGTVSFVMPAASMRVAWGATGGGVTWTARCVVPLTGFIPVILKGNP